MSRWKQIESVYQSALERDEGQRAAFLHQACGGDEELRREVESLLAYDASAQGFMAKSALQVTAKRLATDQAPSLVGRQFGAYQIVSRIGAGGMGVVYRATDTRLNRPVAIKVLHSHLAAQAVWRQRFEREARAISNLSHPHICALHDIGREGDSDFLVMEYLEGETLAQRLKKGALPAEQVLRYAIETASALDQAHLHGVTHRDLKPGNIMLTRTGLKLLDFGLAKQTGGTGAPARVTDERAQSARSTQSESITEEGMILGTLHYMAPEQVEGKEADARTDIFALGVVIYEMATGRKAFEGESKASLAAAILTSQPPPITTIQPLTPPVLERVVQRCLAKDPEERWQSARDLAVELKWIAEGQSAMIVPAAAEIQRGKRARLAAVSGLALLLLFLAGWFISRGYPNHSTSETGAIRFIVPLPDNKVFGFAAISPDGQKLAIFGGAGELWIRPLKSDKAYSLASIGNVAPEDRFWSPDGRFVAFWEMGPQKATLKKVEVTGGTPKTICETAIPTPADNVSPGSSFGCGSWNREGVILFERGEQPKGISRVSAEGGTPVTVTTVDESREETDHVFPSFLPDGRHFLYGVRSRKEEHSGIYLGSLDSPESRRLQDSSHPEKFSFFDMWCVYAPPGYLLYKRQGQLLARAFDAKSLRFTGDPLLLEDQPRPLSEPSISENGTLCYGDWFFDFNSQVTKFDRSGKKIDTIGPTGGYIDMDLSPDGTRLALDQVDNRSEEDIWTWTRPEGDIWTLDLRRAVKTRLTTGVPPVRNFCPRWSADGNQVLFSSNREFSGWAAGRYGNLYSKPSSGEGSEIALLKSKQPKVISDASRDGRYILYGRSQIDTPRFEFDLWVLPLFGERKPFLFLQSAYQGRFSPDGRWVAYTEPVPAVPEDLAKMNVYVRSFPSGEGKWRISTNGGRAPRWRGDGRELFYWTEDRKMMSVEVKPGADFQISPPKVVFESVKVDPKSEDNNQRYAVSPDGQYFYMLVDQTPPTVTQIQVVLNWTADVPKK